MLRKLRTFMAMSPEYQVYLPSYDPPDPGEYGRDVCVVEAHTKREAKIIAYRHWSKQRRNYFQDCCVGDHVPYKHIELYELDLEKYTKNAEVYGFGDLTPQEEWGKDYVKWESNEI